MELYTIKTALFLQKISIVAYCRDTNHQDILVHKKNKMLFFFQQIQYMNKYMN